MGTAISETKLMDKWAASKRTQVSAILCIKLLPLLENALKLNFKALYETENLDPLQGPTHTLTPSSIHTQNRPKNYGWIYHLLSSLAGYSPKLTATLKNRGLATLGFQKKFHAHQLKPTQAKASFQKVNLPPAKLGMLFHVHLSVTEFGHTSTPSHQPSPATIPAKFALTRKWAGPVMPKGQLSRVPWPGSCRRLFTFQAVLRPLQQTHKHSCSLHLAIHTQIAHRYIQSARIASYLKVFKQIFKVPHGHIRVPI